ncbi:acetyl-CoA acetyltransferase [Litorimonas cladophorae]|nr:acetyl-CoA acetyltransferase [Litorimonas cladophorae]
MQDNTPILIGVGQYMEPVPENLKYWDSEPAGSHADMAGHAAVAAMMDAGLYGESVDWMASVRTFSDSSPAYACPFGGPNKFPLAVAARIGATPATAIYDVIGGQSPQTLVAEAAQALMSGEVRVAVIAGGEALANMRAAQRSGTTLDWSEEHEGDWTDRGPFQGAMIVSQTELAHGLIDAMSYYGFIETARRLRAGRSVGVHRRYMAELIAPMSEVASRNPFAMFKEVFTADDIATPSAANRNLISPYLKNMVAKDGINQGAAVVMTTIGTARELGVPENKWVYLRGHAQAQENLMLDRADISRSVAMDIVIAEALKAADASTSDIDHADIYSCFPCVVDQAATQLDRKGKPMTLTGGLPFFGGPGNNYTLHGICEVVAACRRAPGSLGLAHGNGGWMSKQAVGLYSTVWKDGDVFADTTAIAAQVAAQSSPGHTDRPSGPATMESYIVQHKRGEPVDATLIGQLEDGTRFYAKLQDMDAAKLTALAAGELDGARLKVETAMPANKAWLA